eukprot:scaffold791_cov171-Skeletonema_marinoi.AAC.1
MTRCSSQVGTAFVGITLRRYSMRVVNMVLDILACKKKMKWADGLENVAAARQEAEGREE